jgi:hypothetical protein
LALHAGWFPVITSRQGWCPTAGILNAMNRAVFMAFSYMTILQAG